jgi:microsomal dipeptidase-like Zn-dependent dipeptidase
MDIKKVVGDVLKQRAQALCVAKNDRLPKQKLTWEKKAVQLKAQQERVVSLEHQMVELKQDTLGPALAKARDVDKHKKDVKSQAKRKTGLKGKVQLQTKRLSALQAEVQEETDAHNELGAANKKQSRVKIALRDLRKRLSRQEQSLRDLKDKMSCKDYSLSMAAQDKAARRNKITKLENMVRDGVI